MIEVHIKNYGMTIHLPDGLSLDQLAAAIAQRFPQGKPPIELRGRGRATLVEPYVHDDAEAISGWWSCIVNPAGDLPPQRSFANGIAFGLAEDLEKHPITGRSR
jgi:hypothetical protein